MIVVVALLDRMIKVLVFALIFFVGIGYSDTNNNNNDNVGGINRFVQERVYPLPRTFSQGPSQDCLYFDTNSFDFNFDGWTVLENKHIHQFFQNVLAMFPQSDPFTHKPIRDDQRPIEVIKTPATGVQRNITRNPDHKYYNAIPIGDNEHYEIRASDTSLKIFASSVFGVYHALKTVLEISFISHAPLDGNMMYSSFCVPHLPLRIVDGPRYAYRGLLLDTGRAFYQVSTIKGIIDAMCLLKMNVLHWHITDDQSFPMEMPEPYRKDFEKSLYHVGFIHNKLKSPTGIYSKAVFKNIDRYAISRGIRIIPEVDMPSHTRSWGVAYKNLTAKCPEYLKSKHNSLNGDYTYNVPLDVSNPFVYKLITTILTQLKESFSDPYIHLGGDEVAKECWAEDINMKHRMTERAEGQYSEPETYTNYFFKQLKKIIAKTLPNKTVMMWEDIIPMVTDSLIHDSSQGDKLVFQLWKGTDHLFFMSQQKKKRFIYSFENYLDPSYQQCKTFLECYKQSSLDDNPMLQHNNSQMLGIEACAWELVPQSNPPVFSMEMNGDEKERSFQDRVWHRLIAISEKTWYNPFKLDEKQTIDSVVNRAQVIATIMDHALNVHAIDKQSIMNLDSTIDRISHYEKEFK